MKRRDGIDVCKTCAIEAADDGVAVDDIPKAKIRPAPHPGPRCVTHHRTKVAADKARAQSNRDSNVYGMQPGDYEFIYNKQGRKCSLCQRATGKARRLSIDHDHNNGLVRGLLCRPCNDVLGHARDDVQYFLRAVEYLLNPPAGELARVVKTAPVKGRVTTVDPLLDPAPF